MGNEKAQIESIYRMKLSLFYGVLKAAEKDGLSRVGSFNSWGVAFKFEYSPKNRELLFLWEYGGQQRKQLIRLKAEESNLIKGSLVYYFICPYCGLKSRKLFTDLKTIAGRRSFLHYYKQQRQSHSGRVLSRLTKEEPVRKYGKEVYRGKLTPYGLRLLKYELKYKENLIRAYESLLNSTKKDL